MVPPSFRWFAEPNDVFSQSPLYDGGKDCTNLRFLATLAYLNDSSTEVTQAVTRPAENKFGRMGLEPDEAFHLICLWHTLKGIIYAVGNENHEHDVLEFVGREIKLVAGGGLVLEPTGIEIAKFTK